MPNTYISGPRTITREALASFEIPKSFSVLFETKEKKFYINKATDSGVAFLNDIGRSLQINGVVFTHPSNQELDIDTGKKNFLREQAFSDSEIENIEKYYTQNLIGQFALGLFVNSTGRLIMNPGNSGWSNLYKDGNSKIWVENEINGLQYMKDQELQSLPGSVKTKFSYTAEQGFLLKEITYSNSLLYDLAFNPDAVPLEQQAFEERIALAQEEEALYANKGSSENAGLEKLNEKIEASRQVELAIRNLERSILALSDKNPLKSQAKIVLDEIKKEAKNNGSSKSKLLLQVCEQTKALITAPNENTLKQYADLGDQMRERSWGKIIGSVMGLLLGIVLIGLGIVAAVGTLGLGLPLGLSLAIVGIGTIISVAAVYEYKYKTETQLSHSMQFLHDASKTTSIVDAKNLQHISIAKDPTGATQSV